MELRNKVVLNADDMTMVEEFFQQYNDPATNNLVITEDLRKEIEFFRSNSSYSVEDQNRFTVALTGALIHTTHPLLQDEAIKDVMTSCKTVWNDAKFYEEFEKVIQVPEVPEASQAELPQQGLPLAQKQGD